LRGKSRGARIPALKAEREYRSLPAPIFIEPESAS
jgi:hypothetical protein